MQLTGSQVIIECLKEQGVDTVFGYPGGAILNVYDELYKHPEIRHVLTSHEQGFPCSRRICQKYRKSRSLYGNKRTGSHQSGDRYRNCVYGFHSDRGNHLQCWGITPEKTVFRKLILLVSQHRLQNTVLL